MSKKKQKKVEEQTVQAVKPQLKRKEKHEREDFRKFFLRIKKKLNLDASLEEIMWLHFKASGFAEIAKFEQGVKHFGYKI